MSLISPEELRIPSYIREDVLRENNIEFEEVERLEDDFRKLDVLYMTRVQKERFFNEEDYVRMKDFYILDKRNGTCRRICSFFIRSLVSMRSQLKLTMTRELLTS